MNVAFCSDRFYKVKQVRRVVNLVVDKDQTGSSIILTLHTSLLLLVVRYVRSIVSWN